MDAAVDAFVSQKIQEILVSCGINGSEDQEVKCCATQLSTYVHQSRLNAGIKDPFCPPHQLRGSYRILKYSEKQGRKDFKGLASRNKKKRKTTTHTPKSTNNGHTRALPQASEKANSGQMDVPDSRDATGNAALTVGEKPVNAAKAPTTDDALRNDSNDSNLGECQEATQTALASPMVSRVIWQQDPAGTTRVMTSILLDCLKLNFVIGKHGRETKQMFKTTKTKQVREWIDYISGLDYARAVSLLKKENAFLAGQEILKRYHDTAIWTIISKGAALLDPATLPTARGPLDEFTMAEKVATRKFMEEVGYGTSPQNQRLWRNLWKNLFLMRKDGVDRILFYRIKEFDAYCKGYPRPCETPLLKMVLSWEKTYGPQIELLEHRATRWSQGDFTGQVYLDDPDVAQRLEVQDMSWNNAANNWLSSDEESAAQLAGVNRDIPSQLWNPYDINTISENSANKSIFISLVPADDKRLMVCPIIPVRKGDFLGIFAGTIRFSDSFDLVHGIRGPVEKLWLDYSKVTGPLNQMRVLQSGSDANVQLQWELINEEDETQSKLSWRVSVRALRVIVPFQEIVREQ
ncbi:hypothetical protein AtubIFM54640_010718 [Aspergillus tubingensis]|nr:hypothetical protein AtubIFM54640_010718 [Aspergillus tubingensis]